MANATTTTTHASSFLSPAFIYCLWLIFSCFIILIVHSRSASFFFSFMLSSASLVITLRALPCHSSSSQLTKAQASYPCNYEIVFKMSGGINSSKMMNLALTSKGQLRNCLPMSNPSVHTRRVGVWPCTQLSASYFSAAQNLESNSCCGSLESCSRSGGSSLS